MRLPTAFALLFLSARAFADERFEKHVRPLLAEQCHGCHGPKKQMGGLRLDSREALMRGGDSGPAIHSGEPDKSLLILAIRHVGERKMPPKKKLDARQIDELAAWVKAGTPWPATSIAGDADAWKKHWAFQPTRRASVPEAPFVLSAADAFLSAKLNAKGLSLSPEADRATLVRRVTLVLIGLPPTPEEVEAARNDKADDWYERIVERLLASPHHGERWGRHWLDVARYADTKGYVFFEENGFPWAWTYRDYLIRALNEDKPYSRFVQEQLAADLIDGGKDRRSLPALGFLALGGRFMNNVHDILDDRIDVATRGLMGLTVTCARCHDHKFDPIPTRDYYSLYGVFASSQEPAVPPEFQEPAKTAEYEKFVKELAAREGKLADFLEGKRRDLQELARKRSGEYLLAVHKSRGLPDAQEFMLIAEGNDLNPTMVARWRAQIRRSLRTKEPVFALFHRLSALPEKGFEMAAKALVESADAPGNRAVLAALRAKLPKNMEDVCLAYGDLFARTDTEWKKLAGKAAALPDAETEQVRQALYGADAAANVPPGQISELQLLPDRASQGVLQKLRNEVQDWRVKGAGAPPRATILVDLPRPVEPRIFQRGNPGNLGEPVPRRFLEVLAGKERRAFSQGSGRLELAQAIADPANPLTWRVAVNRVWMHHFGRGLVATPGDFGMRSEPPSHPELLDYLASRFAQEQSLKGLHRLIVTSAAYRQSSADSPAARKIDPENLLLWRYPRRRLDFEALRDSLLAVSGRLERPVGGPSVQDNYQGNRRTLYTHLDRLNMATILRTFDVPSADATSPQRVETTVPQQALFLMNSPFAQDCARRLAARGDVALGKTIEYKADRLHRILFGRAPSRDELHLAEEFLQKGDAESWARYAQALLLTNEFQFVD